MLLFMFQRDVSGMCDTSYTVAQQGWLSLTIKKSKDMSSCTDRHGYETAIQTTPFRISSVSVSMMIVTCFRSRVLSVLNQVE